LRRGRRSRELHAPDALRGVTGTTREPQNRPARAAYVDRNAMRALHDPRDRFPAGNFRVSTTDVVVRSRGLAAMGSSGTGPTGRIPGPQMPLPRWWRRRL